jgi:hypothetical protein
MRTHHDTNMEGWPCRPLYCLHVFLDRYDRKRSIRFRPLRSIFVPIGEHYMSVPYYRFVFSHMSLQMERELLIGVQRRKQHLIRWNGFRPYQKNKLDTSKTGGT